MAKVLFVCTQNAGRSQMSEALFQRIGNGRHESRSAGTRPAAHVHPVVIDAMREQGIDLSERRPQKLADDLAQWADVVVTMGCRDECPYIPGKKYIDWDLADPAGKSLDEVRAIRDDINGLVNQLATDLDHRSANDHDHRSAKVS
ncbi:MAG TPA: arsenate reductase ArsC [Candidatus Dormibacteraeota bacterium]|nr:arsenate reductase ArsC [Candidatus Dormibacteraeota bacterium]